jgi:hypothetical protein
MSSASHRVHHADVTDSGLKAVGDDARQSPDPVAVSPPASDLIRRLKELTTLNDVQLAELLGATSADLRRWARGQAMHEVGAEHLLEILAVVEDAHRRFRTAEQTRLALLRPVGPGRPRPFDYLRDRSYLIAGGFLQRLPERVDPIRDAARSARKLPLDIRLATLEELSPTPRFELDDDFLT